MKSIIIKTISLCGVFTITGFAGFAQEYRTDISVRDQVMNNATPNAQYAPAVTETPAAKPMERIPGSEKKLSNAPIKKEGTDTPAPVASTETEEQKSLPSAAAASNRPDTKAEQAKSKEELKKALLQEEEKAKEEQR